MWTEIDSLIFQCDAFLYNFSLLCEDEKQAVAVKSQLQQIARPMYSNPPVQGALIVSTILGDPELKKLWLKEVKVIYYSCVLSWTLFTSLSDRRIQLFRLCTSIYIGILVDFGNNLIYLPLFTVFYECLKVEES